MDALALLCNLYGDGPQTLDRLRRAGIASLDAVQRRDPKDLADILGFTGAATQRFQVQATQLEQRFLGPPADPKPATVEVPALASAQEFALPTAVGPAFEASSGRAGSGTSHPLVEQALAEWRKRDDEDPPAALPSLDSEDEFKPLVLQVACTPATALRPGTLDGLDERLCAQLRVLGLQTLEEFVAAMGLDISQRLDIGLTRIMRLQFLARRQLLERAPRGLPQAASPGAMLGTQEWVVPNVSGAWSRARGPSKSDGHTAAGASGAARESVSPAGASGAARETFSPSERPSGSVSPELIPDVPQRAAAPKARRAGDLPQETPHPGPGQSGDTSGPFA